MLKKFILVSFMLLFCVTGFANEPQTTNVEPASSRIMNAVFADSTETAKVAVFLEAPVTFVNNEKVREAIPAKAAQLFTKPKFSVVPFSDSQMAMRTYREDNDLMGNNYVQPALKRTDIQAMSKELGAKYAMFIIISNDAPRMSAGLFSLSFKTTVSCDVRVLDVEQGKYIVSKQIVKDGSSTAVLSGVPSFDKAYLDALDKSLTELKIDTSAM